MFRWVKGRYVYITEESLGQHGVEINFRVRRQCVSGSWYTTSTLVVEWAVDCLLTSIIISFSESSPEDAVEIVSE